MAKKVMSITVDQTTLDAWRKYTDAECINASQLMERLMQEHLKKRGAKHA